MTFDALQNLLQGAIDELAEGSDVIWMRQDAPRPANPYIGLWAPRMERETEPDSRQIVDGPLVTENLRLHYSVMLDIEAFGGKAMDTVWKIQRGLYMPAIREALGDVALVNTENPIDTTTLLDQQWEQRARFTAQFRLAVDTTAPLDWIETVNLKRAPTMPGASPP